MVYRFIAYLQLFSFWIGNCDQRSNQRINTDFQSINATILVVMMNDGCVSAYQNMQPQTVHAIWKINKMITIK